VETARTGLQELLTTPIKFTPAIERGRRVLRFEGQIGLAPAPWLRLR